MTISQADFLRKHAKALLAQADTLDANRIRSLRRTYVALVLDSSGSMESCKQGTIDGFNAAIRSLKNTPASAGEIRVSFYTIGINSAVKLEWMNRSVANLEYLTNDTYTPDGGTPLYDGIGSAIQTLKACSLLDTNTDTAFLVNIFTDGHENTSTIWTGPKLSARIRELQANGRWTFTVAGANISLQDLANKTGIPMNNMQSFVSNDTGAKQMFGQYVNSSQQYFTGRSAGASQSNTFYDQSQQTAEQQRRMVAQQQWTQTLHDARPIPDVDKKDEVTS